MSALKAIWSIERFLFPFFIEGCSTTFKVAHFQDQSLRNLYEKALIWYNIEQLDPAVWCCIQCLEEKKITRNCTYFWTMFDGKKRKRRRFQSAFLINHSFLGMEIISTSFHKSLEYMFVFLSFLKDREVECWNINARVNRKFVHRMKDSVVRPNSNLDKFKTSGLFKKDYLGLDNCASNWSDRTSELYSTYSIVHFLGFYLHKL